MEYQIELQQYKRRWWYAVCVPCEDEGNSILSDIGGYGPFVGWRVQIDGKWYSRYIGRSKRTYKKASLAAKKEAYRYCVRHNKQLSDSSTYIVQSYTCGGK